MFLGDVPDGVVPVAGDETVQALLLDEAIQRIIGKTVGGVVLVDQTAEAAMGVVFVLEGSAQGVGALGGFTEAIQRVFRDVPFRIGIADEMALGVVGEAFGAVVGVLDGREAVFGVVAIVRGLAQGVGGPGVVLVLVERVGGLASFVVGDDGAVGVVGEGPGLTRIGPATGKIESIRNFP